MILRENKRNVCAIRMCYGGGKIWFLHAFLNLLYSVDVNTGKTCCYKLPIKIQSRVIVVHYFSNITYINGKVWMIPGLVREIVIFDENTEKFTSFIPDDMKEINREREYIYAIDSMNLEGTLVMFPHTDTIIRKFDVETCHQENIDICKYIKEEWYGGNLVIKINDSECFLTRLGSSTLLHFNLKTDEINIFETELKEATELSAVILNKRLYVYTNTIGDSFVYEIDIRSGKIINKCFLKDVDTDFIKLGSINDRYLAVEYTTKQKTVLLSADLDILSEIKNEKNEVEDFKIRFYAEIPWRVWLQLKEDTCYCLLNSGNQMEIYKDADIYPEKVYQISIDEEMYDRTIDNYKKDIFHNEYLVHEGKYGKNLREYLNDIISFC